MANSTLANTASNITILSQAIRQNDGLYSLNDLHKAAGAERRHGPSLFMANAQTAELVREIENTGIPVFKQTRGRYGGTYACREMVIAYAAWVNPKFHLAVLQNFLDTQAPAALPPQTLTPESQLQLRKAVAEKAKRSRAAYSIIYGFLYDHFKVAKYSQIRESDLSAALGFIQGIEISLPELPAPDNASLAFQLDQSVPLTYEQVMADLRRLSDALQRHGYTDATYACQNAESLINRQCGIIQHFHLSVAHYASLSQKPLERKRAA